jgi:membrane associated rhomboid family serine protease
MNEQAWEAGVAAQSRDRARCLELKLVLDAAGIPGDTAFDGGWWLLLVRVEDLERARSELRAYREENPATTPLPPPALPRYGGGAAGVIGYAAVLLLVAYLAGDYAFGADWYRAGRMNAGQVLSGEGWRVVTALTLHGDAGHLTANLVFGALFGGLASLAFGGGVAWLAILLGGTFGNVLNALVQSPGHTSVGASTAVFAALGLLVADAIRRRHHLPASPLRRWSPLVGGILLLAYTGTGGERTDVVAHLTGFLAGLALGVPLSRASPAWLGRPRLQSAAGGFGLALIALGWLLALAAA